MKVAFVAKQIVQVERSYQLISFSSYFLAISHHQSKQQKNNIQTNLNHDSTKINKEHFIQKGKKSRMNFITTENYRWKKNKNFVDYKDVFDGKIEKSRRFNVHLEKKEV